MFPFTIAVIAWFGLVLQFSLTIPARMTAGYSLSSALAFYFSFFTILTNLIVAASLTMLLSGRRRPWLERASTQTAIAASIIFVGIAYEMLLRSIWKPTGPAFVADTTLHDIVPVLFAVYWTTRVPKGHVRWSDVPRWVIYPALYLLYALVRGAFTGEYPYYFLDAGKLGYAATSVSIVGLLAGILVISAILKSVDQWMAKQRTAQT